jgi:hypothetical protein
MICLRVSKNGEHLATIGGKKVLMLSADVLVHRLHTEGHFLNMNATL